MAGLATTSVRRHLATGFLAASAGYAALLGVASALPHAAALPVAALAGLLVLAILTQVLLQRALSPLDRLHDAIHRLASGDGDVTSAARDPGPFEDLCRSILSLQEEMEELNRLVSAGEAEQAERQRAQTELATAVDALGTALARLADGDLSAPLGAVRFPAGLDGLRASHDLMIGRIGQSLARVQTLAAAVRDGSQEISHASEELSSRTETQAATLEQSAAAIGQLTESVRATAERALLAEQASRTNREGAELGAGIVSEVVSAMQEIERSSDQITRIIGVIDEIAFQTNLLALNAGVEAARAGEAGRGFAVVASEVRLLAQRASDSAREIKGLISESEAQVKKGSALVGRAGESLSAILQRATEAAGLVADIARAAAEQASGLNEINVGINQLDQVTQQNSAVAEETSASAAALLAKSEELIAEFSAFRLQPEVGPATSADAATPRPTAEQMRTSGLVVPLARQAAAARPAAALPMASNADWADF